MKERFTIWLVWKLPRYLVYWCAVRVHAHATTGAYSSQVVPELTALTAMKRWNDPDPTECESCGTTDPVRHGSLCEHYGKALGHPEASRGFGLEDIVTSTNVAKGTGWRSSGST